MKKILITGGTKGVGFAICERFLDDGFEVVAVGRSEFDRSRIKIDHRNSFHYVRFDLSVLGKIHEFTADLHRRFGVFYALVNNAAIGKDGVLATQHEKDIELIVRTNLLAPILLTKYIARQMLAKKTGRVVFISSIVADTGFSGLSVYGATKAGLIGLTKSLSREFGKFGITVNAIAPGFMSTEMTEGLNGEKLAAIMRRSPSGRLASTIDVASVASFLVSENAGAINGATITVDAGSTA